MAKESAAMLEIGAAAHFNADTLWAAYGSGGFGRR